MSVRVVARIRPLLDKELGETIVRADRVDDGKPLTVVKIPNPKNEGEEFSFAFNSVYDQATTQEALFNAEVAPHVKALFQGLDVTIFAYGVTGTGKTHTMRGGLRLADRGVIPRLLSNVFRRSKKIAKDTGGQTVVEVALSYYEIYNDKVFDLLEPPEKRTPSGLPLREGKDGRTNVVGLSEHVCVDLKDFEQIYIEANANRVTAATKLNAHSSRSHAILRVKLTQTTTDDQTADRVTVRESTASAIDLAGSEDNRRTDNGRDRLVESAAINKSLFVLSQCVDAISRGDKRVPYRESKMTRILSLGQNNGITIMLLNLAPLRSYHLDTLSSLNVSSRAKRIEVREIENEIVYKQPPRSMTSGSGASAGTGGQGGAGGAGAGLQRQPLQPLANAHNVHSGKAAAAAAAAGKDTKDRPVKAFSVYTDRGKPVAALRAVAPAANSGQPRRSNSTKRPSDTIDGAVNRPAKVARNQQGIPRPVVVHGAPRQPPSISAAQIEAMVERKVSEILASRAAAEAAAQPAPVPAPAPMTHAPGAEPAATKEDASINEEVRRRLEILERRIDVERRDNGDDQDDDRSMGLRLLVQARRAKELGDEESALKAYEAALPFLPGQPKLLVKIERLRAKLANKQGQTASNFVVADMEEEKSARSDAERAKAERRKEVAASRRHAAEDANEYHANTGVDEDGNDADSEFHQNSGDDDMFTSPSRGASKGARRKGTATARKPKKKRGAPSTSTSQFLLPAVPAEAPAASSCMGDGGRTGRTGAGPLPTPRTRKLLDIVNSRDLAKVRKLHGFGAKKAQDLVGFLHNLNEEEGEGTFGQVVSLAQLKMIPGMGGRTVERAYEGLEATEV